MLTGLHSFLEALRDNPFSYPFQLLEATPIPWLVAVIFKASNARPSSHAAISLVLSLLPPSTVKAACDYIEFSQLTRIISPS